MSGRVRGSILVAVLIAGAGCRSAGTPPPIVEPPLEPPPAAAPPPPSIRPTPPPRAASPPAANPAARAPERALVRVALATSGRSLTISSLDPWELLDRDGAHVLVRAPAGEQWNIERDGRMLRAGRADGLHTDWVAGPVVARLADTGVLVENGKRYRGELHVSAADSGLVIVNRLPLEDYLLGVVPLEIGPRAPAESAAVQAQAVAARSYADVRIGAGTSVSYDLTSTVLDQVYGGVDAETAVGTKAVESTRGLVLKYAGRVVSAPYHSSCGGVTAEPQEVWHSDSVPYLKSVSDRIPGTDRYYCDIAPNFQWMRTFTASQLDADIARYLASYTSVPGGTPGTARDVSVASRTPSGRVGLLTITTSRGNFALRGNDIRFVLRAPSGEILNSTYFSVETTMGPDGRLAALVVHGTGNGHGVGMCQWGAIGRARAGQDFRTILATYYPGTTVEPIE